MTKLEFETRIVEATNRARALLNSRFKLKKHDMDDVLQNASLKAFKSLDSFIGRSSFETWFMTIALNEARASLNRKDKFSSIDDEDFDEGEILRSPVREEPNKDYLDEVHHLIHGSLSKLTENHRQVVELMLESAPSCEEMAKSLKIPVVSVRTRIFYAKKKLRKILANAKSNGQLLNN